MANKKLPSSLVRGVAILAVVLVIGLFIIPAFIEVQPPLPEEIVMPVRPCDVCLGCHIEVFDELRHSPVHTDMSCIACHPLGKVEPPEQMHAAIRECIMCHGQVDAELRHPYEAHREYYLHAIGDPTRKGGNEACIECHTLVPFEWDFPPARNLTYNGTTGVFGKEPLI